MKKHGPLTRPICELSAVLADTLRKQGIDPARVDALLARYGEVAVRLRVVGDRLVVVVDFRR